jgi:site-specific DNA-methyltransferase (adenine-specific)
MSTFGRNLPDTLYYGDNLEILSRFISDESVDLIYLDPPFNKNAAYSVIFQDESGRISDAQIATLEDYWHWGPTPARHYEYLTNSAEHHGSVPHGVSALIGALHTAIRPSPLLAYLVEMSVRLVELRRVLKRTGSLYLHCDQTASAYLKIVLDAIFGAENFRGEIVWKRTSSHNDSKKWPHIHDTILFYAAAGFTWHPVYLEHDPEYVTSFYRFSDRRGRYRLHEIIRTASMGPRPNLCYEYKGYTPEWGWRMVRDKVAALDSEGRIEWGKSGRPYLRRYLHEQEGTPASSIWTDIPPLSAAAVEKLGYPTQKPLALLERIIAASSDPGDIILDPFCGCGTALEAAWASDRRWIGIDISNLAVQVIRDRMRKVGVEIPVFDWPTEMDGVRRMVEGPDGHHRFEVWALARLGLPENRRGSDAGMDGRIGFTLPSGRVETIIVSVKGGRHVGSPEVRDLKGAMARERAAMGLLFTLDEPSSAAKKEAMEAGFYRSPIDGRQYHKLLIYTARELLEDGRPPDLPTRHGFQEPLWPLPAATRSVRLRSMTPKAPVVAAAQPEARSDVAEAVRERYADQRTDDAAETTSPVAPRSPRTTKRGRQSPLPSRES